MPKGVAKKVAFISSYPPRKCGIGTFVSDLISSVSAYASEKFTPLVVALSNDSYDYPRQVEFEIRPNVKNDYISAAEYLNFSNVDVVSVQHEFGLFGGAAGSYLSLFLQNIKAPVVTTLHTILNEPTAEYYKSMLDLCRYSDKLIVMNARGIDMLRDIYKVPSDKIVLIPHGLPDLPFVDSSYYKHKFDFDGRTTLLTFGLIGRSKGIEVMIEAMSDIVAADSSALYIVLGVTHPELIKFEGESYRFSLQRRVKDLGIEDNVIFHNRFVTDQDLHDFLCATDIYVTPYLAREQLTSGTLAFAVGAGKAVVSTPYWAAEELLADGRGKLVKFGDAKDLAKSIIEISGDRSLFQSMRRRAYDYGRTRTWPRLGCPYWEQFSEVGVSVRPSGPFSGRAKSLAILELPEPPLDHLLRMTDDTGLIQHAKYMLPDRDHGYCTDDNARALVAMTRYYKQYSEPVSLKLLETYLAFTLHSQLPDGSVRNFMHYDRSWRSPEPAHDALGRTIWALGSVIASPPMPMYLSIIKEYFDRSSRHIRRLSPRGMSYAILGLSDYLRQFPGASEIKKLLTFTAESLSDLYERRSCDGWHWFEDVLAYDNAIMPAALFAAAMALGEKRYADIAESSCLFLLEETYNGSYFSFVGSNGWYPKGRVRAVYDQQPIEVASTIIMLRYAYELTVKSDYLKLQRKAFDWFMGDNDLNMPIYDFQTKGCCDGLEHGGVNINQGAESIVSFLLSLLYVVESFTGAKSDGKSDTIITTVDRDSDLPVGRSLLDSESVSAESV